MQVALATPRKDGADASLAQYSKRPVHPSTSFANQSDFMTVRVDARPVHTFSHPPVRLHSTQHSLARQLSDAKFERRGLRSSRCTPAAALTPRSAVKTPRGLTRLVPSPQKVADEPALQATRKQATVQTMMGSLGKTPTGMAPSPAASPPKSPTADCITPPARTASTRPAETDVPEVASTVTESEFSPRKEISPPPRRVSTRPAQPLVPGQVFRHKELGAAMRCVDRSLLGVHLWRHLHVMTCCVRPGPVF